MSDNFEIAYEGMKTADIGAISDFDKIKLYSLYQQATIGDNQDPKPGMMDFRGKAKWDAWNELQGVSEFEV